jgi:CheY-like chemotaxis protein
MPTATILIIEDDLATAALLREALEIDGYHVLHAMGDTAIALARDEHPRVILLDIDMPGMDGPEVSRHLRADPDTRAIPIICMSARDGRAHIPADMRYDDYLPKPFRVDDLYALVARWLT